MNDIQLSDLQNHCESLNRQIEKTVWSSERIRLITSTFQEGKATGLSVNFGTSKRRFLYTLLIVLQLGSTEGEWNRLLLLSVMEKIEKQKDLWLDVRTKSDITLEVLLKLNLLYDPEYNLKHFYSIVYQPGFINKVRETSIGVIKEKTGPVTKPQRKRGYHDKGSLRPKHVSQIWLEECSPEEFERRIRDFQLLRQQLMDLHQGFIG